MSGLSIVICDGVQKEAESYAAELSVAGHQVTLVHNESQLKATLISPQFCWDLLLLDLSVCESDAPSYIESLLGVDEGNHTKLKNKAVVVIAGGEQVSVAVRAMQAGATDFIARPVKKESLLGAVARVKTDLNIISETRKTERVAAIPVAASSITSVKIEAKKEKNALHTKQNEPDISSQEPHSLERWRTLYAPFIIGQDQRLLEVLDVIERVCDTDCSLLVTGPSGSGKELIARAVHAASPRADKPFVAINCAAIPSDLMESEIFGHAKGAFTGATERRQGKFAVADGGTLFLDEVGEMEIGLQGKFLRVLQEREFTPVGDTKVIKSDVRIVAATNQDLLERCKEGLFREDLFYRLNVIPVELPALNERGRDVVVLAEHFLSRACERYGRRIDGIDDEASTALAAYQWPGNIRELENLIERVAVLKKGDGQLTLADLPPHLVAEGLAGIPKVDSHLMELPEGGVVLKDILAEVEIHFTLAALKRSDGKKTQAAKLLGLKRTTLIERMKRLGLSS